MTERYIRLGLVAILAAGVVPMTDAQDLDRAAAPSRFDERIERARQRDRNQDRDDDDRIERFTRTISLPAGGELDLSNLSGDIDVTGTSGRDVVIEVTKRARRRRDAAEQLASVEVEIDARGDRIEVRTRYQRSDRNTRVSVSYDVMVPRDIAVSVQSVSGDLAISGVDGEVRAETVSGDVDIRRATQLAHATTVSGDLRLADIAADGELRLSSVSGDARVRDASAQRVSLETVSGDLDLTGMRFDRFDMNTVSGDIEYEGELVDNGRYSITTHSGDVRLTLTENVGFELEANSFSGSVRSDLPVILRGSGGRDERGRGRRNRNVVGTFGDGSAQIDITTFSGDVVISRR